MGYCCFISSLKMLFISNVQQEDSGKHEIGRLVAKQSQEVHTERLKL